MFGVTIFRKNLFACLVFYIMQAGYLNILVIENRNGVDGQ
jgi:hypothetical protein